MTLYQLKLKELNMVLDPVFNTKEAALLFKSKYHDRMIEIKEINMEPNSQDNYIYRIETMESDGTYLEDEIFPSLESALSILKSNQRVVKENIIGSNTFRYAIVDAL